MEKAIKTTWYKYTFGKILPSSKAHASPFCRIEQEQGSWYNQGSPGVEDTDMLTKCPYTRRKIVSAVENFTSWQYNSKVYDSQERYSKPCGKNEHGTVLGTTVCKVPYDT